MQKLHIFIRLQTFGYFQKIDSPNRALKCVFWCTDYGYGQHGVVLRVCFQDTILAPLWDPHSWHWDNTRLLKFTLKKTNKGLIPKQKSIIKNSLERGKTGKFENLKKSSSNVTSAKLSTLLFLRTTFQFFSKIGALQSNKSGRIW